MWHKLRNLYLRLKYYFLGRPQEFLFSFDWQDTRVAVYTYDRPEIFFVTLLESGYYETCCYVEIIGPVIRRTNFLAPRTPYIETLFFRDVNYQQVEDIFLKSWYESYKLYKFRRDLKDVLRD